MPRRHLPPRKAYAALAALRLQSARREAVRARREHHAREAALALRRATPDWIDLDKQVKRLQLETEMEAMEACLEDRRPKVPTLNFDLMPGFSPAVTSTPVASNPAAREPAVHPDVKIQAELTARQEPRPVNENRRPPPQGENCKRENWTFESTIDGRNPADDWRNWE